MSWWRDGVLYQIYPRSFQDSNGDGIGDLEGIRKRLDHLSWLGVDGVWLSPFNPSPQADFGYDVADYCDVDPAYGDLETFDRLVADAHARGLKVIVDWVPNHTSDEHPWFAESRSSRDNPKRGWYVWRDPIADVAPPNNWLSVFGGPAWTLDEATGQYYLHSFLRRQPELDWRHPEVVAAMHDTLRFWLDRGVDGFRIDVVYRIAKDPALRDNPWIEGADRSLGFRAQERIHSQNHPDVHDLCRAIRGVIDAYPDRMAVGEVTILDPTVVSSFYGEGCDELHLNFNFHFAYRDWDASDFAAAIEAHEEALPQGAWPCWALSNHDVPRHAARFGPERARAAAVFLLTLRGTPFLFQGEEIGMTGCRPPRPLDVVGRDVCRTPIQWDDSPHAGFTTGSPWLPVCRDGVTVSAQREEPNSLLHLYRDLMALRRRTPALRSGDYTDISVTDGVLTHERVADDSRARTVVNFTAEDRPLDPAGWEVALTTHAMGEDVLPAHAAAILVDRPSAF